MSSELSKDAKAIMLDNQLRDLKAQRAKVRPATYILLALVGIGLGVILLPSMLAFLFGIIGLASGLAAVTAISKGSKIDREIQSVQEQVTRL